jgi:hypothetical protein
MDEDKSGASKRGCKFAGRCPHVMEKCRQSPPPLYQIEENQVAACYLYEDSPQLAGEQLGDLFAAQATPVR